jgi:hypothetical protein
VKEDEDNFISDREALRTVAATLLFAVHRLLDPESSPNQLMGRVMSDTNCLFKQTN